MTMRELDPLLHSQLRLAIISLLLSVEEADFNYLKETSFRMQVILKSGRKS